MLPRSSDQEGVAVPWLPVVTAASSLNLYGHFLAANGGKPGQR